MILMAVMLGVGTQIQAHGDGGGFGAGLGVGLLTGVAATSIANSGSRRETTDADVRLHTVKSANASINRLARRNDSIYRKAKNGVLTPSAQAQIDKNNKEIERYADIIADAQ